MQPAQALTAYFNDFSKDLQARCLRMWDAMDDVRTPEEKSQGIPVIDLSLYEKDREAWSVCFVGSLAKNGFAIFKNHGVPDRDIDAAYDSVRQFFAQPQEEIRQKYAIDPTEQRGLGVYGGETHRVAVGSDERKGDMKEYLMFGREDLTPEEMAEHDIETNIWPDIPGNFRQTLIALESNIAEVESIALKALGTGLGLDEDYFTEMTRYGDTKWRAIHYPPLEEAVNTGGERSGRHTDGGLCTLLLSSGQRGLVVMPDLYDESTWLRPPTGAGYMVFNAGKLLDRMTNGFIPATWHKVDNSADPHESRVSIPRFIWPSKTCTIEDIPCPPPLEDTVSRKELTERLIRKYPTGIKVSDFMRTGLSVVRRAHEKKTP